VNFVPLPSSLSKVTVPPNASVMRLSARRKVSAYLKGKGCLSTTHNSHNKVTFTEQGALSQQEKREAELSLHILDQQQLAIPNRLLRLYKQHGQNRLNFTQTLNPLIHDVVKFLKSLPAHPRNNIVNTVNPERLQNTPTSFNLLKNILNRLGARVYANKGFTHQTALTLNNTKSTISALLPQKIKQLMVGPAGFEPATDRL
jgi:hypothetical protein